MTESTRPVSNLNLTQLLTYREIGKPKPLTQFVKAYIKGNIQTLNCAKTIVNLHSTEINQLLAYDDGILSAGTSIKRWNSHTNTCDWAYTPDQDVEWLDFIPLEDRTQLIALSCNHEMKASLHILSLNNFSAPIIISNALLNTARALAIIGKRIFTECHSHNVKQSCIGEWDLKGHFVDSFPFPNDLSLNHLLLLTEMTDHLIAVNKYYIAIYDLKGRQSPRYLCPSSTMGVETELNFCITAASLSGFRLLIGMRKQTPLSKAFCQLYDLTSDHLLETYEMPELALLNKTLTSSIVCLAIDNQWAYLGLGFGTVVALNLKDKTTKILGRHNRAVSVLKIEDGLLVTASKASFIISGQIMLFDLKSHALLRGIFCDNLNTIAYDKNRLLTGVEGALIIRDFETITSGEQLSSSSESEVISISQHTFLICNTQ